MRWSGWADLKRPLYRPTYRPTNRPPYRHRHTATIHREAEPGRHPAPRLGPIRRKARSTPSNASPHDHAPSSRAQPATASPRAQPATASPHARHTRRHHVRALLQVRDPGGQPTRETGHYQGIPRRKVVRFGRTTDLNTELTTELTMESTPPSPPPEAATAARQARGSVRYPRAQPPKPRHHTRRTRADPERKRTMPIQPPTAPISQRYGASTTAVAARYGPAAPGEIMYLCVLRVCDPGPRKPPNTRIYQAIPARRVG